MTSTIPSRIDIFRRLRSLSGELLLITSGRVIYSASIWLAVIVIARGYGAETLGSFTYAMAVIAPLIIFFQFNARVFVLTEKNDEFLILNHLLFRVAGIVLAFLALLTSLWWSTDSSVYGVALAIFLFKAFESISDIVGGYLHKEGLLRYVCVASALRGLSFLLCAIIAATTDMPIDQACLWIAGSWGLILILVELLPAIRLSHLWKMHQCKIFLLIRRCWLFGPIMALSAIIYNLPIYAVEDLLGKSHVGYYASMMYFYLSGRIVVDALSLALAPRLAGGGIGSALSSRRRITEILGGSAMVLLPAMVAAYVWGPSLAGLIYGDEFATHGQLLCPILALLFVAGINQIFNVVLTIKRETLTQLVAHIVALIAVSVTAPPLIKLLELQGAIASLLIGMILMSAFYAIALLKRRRNEDASQ